LKQQISHAERNGNEAKRSKKKQNETKLKKRSERNKAKKNISKRNEGKTASIFFALKRKEKYGSEMK
jgi:hypothetical protein